MTLPDLFVTLVAVRDSIAGFYEANGVDLPARRLITPGLPVWDCEQFTVTPVSSYNMNGNIQTSVFEQRITAVGFDLRALIIDVAVMRCVAVLGDSGKAPSVAAIEGDAEAVMRDEVTLRAAVRDAVDTGVLPQYTNVAIDNWAAANPSGGIGGSTLRFRLIP
jgi:hypothetical protein